MKDNRKIIIVVALIIMLVGAIYLMNRSQKSASTSADLMGKTSTEVKLTGILSSINGVGITQVMVNEGEEGIVGVVIVCEGADNIMVRNDILNAVSTALNIDKSIIAIYSMNN